MLTKAPMDTAVHRAPGVHMAIKRVRRANGQIGVVPQPQAGEVEVGRYMSSFTQAVVAMTGDGRPPSQSDQPFGMKQVCLGGGEVLLTDKRVATVLSMGESVLGNLNEKNGAVLLLDFPYERIETVELTQTKRGFGGLKERKVRIASTKCPAALDFEPGYILNANSSNAKKTSYSAFMTAIVQAASRLLIDQYGNDEGERKRDDRLAHEPGQLIKLTRPRSGSRKRHGS
jgi:hypothetical protein